VIKPGKEVKTGKYIEGGIQFYVQDKTILKMDFVEKKEKRSILKRRRKRRKEWSST